jgi:hypothetical protein
MTKLVDIVFDGGPGPESPKSFVEVEIDGKSIRLGEWVSRSDGLWALRFDPRTLVEPEWFCELGDGENSAASAIDLAETLDDNEAMEIACCAIVGRRAVAKLRGLDPSGRDELLEFATIEEAEAACEARKAAIEAAETAAQEAAPDGEGGKTLGLGED